MIYYCLLLTFILTILVLSPQTQLNKKKILTVLIQKQNNIQYYAFMFFMWTMFLIVITYQSFICSEL